MARFFRISENELLVLETWAKHGSLNAASEVLISQGKIKSKSTAYNRINSLKNRYRAARELIREMDRWSAKLPSPLEM